MNLDIIINPKQWEPHFTPSCQPGPDFFDARISHLRSFSSLEISPWTLPQELNLKRERCHLQTETRRKWGQKPASPPAIKTPYLRDHNGMDAANDRMYARQKPEQRKWASPTHKKTKNKNKQGEKWRTVSSSGRVCAPHSSVSVTRTTCDVEERKQGSVSRAQSFSAGDGGGMATRVRNVNPRCCTRRCWWASILLPIVITYEFKTELIWAT